MRRLLYLLIALLISGCGFHLRGTGSTATLSFQTVELIGVGNFADAMRNTLKTDHRIVLLNSSETLTPSKDPANKADVEIRVLGENYTREALSLRNNGLVAEYRLTYQARFSVTYRGELLIEDGVQNLTRTMSWDDNNLLGKMSEETTLMRDMQREVAAAIIRRTNTTIRNANLKNNPLPAQY